MTLRTGTSSIAAGIATLLPAMPATAHSQRALTRPATASFQTSRTFQLGPGRAVRTFTVRERSGVILLNRLTIIRGVRIVVDARIPHLAGARVISWKGRTDPSLSCRHTGRFVACTQSEEWCPMPRATWHFKLVKPSGRAGPVRFDFLVAAPPPGS